MPSLVLGCEPSIAAMHKNYSMIYSSHISWSSPTTPTPLELYPALAFDRLFRDEVGRADKSVLDAVLEDAHRLAQQGQPVRPAPARRIPVVGPRGGAADRPGGQGPAAARLAADAGQARHAAPGRRHPAGHRPAHAADVRHPGAGLPHRHHARLHAEAEQRPLVAAVPESEGGLHDPPPAVAHRRRRLAEGEPVLHASRWPTSPTSWTQVQEGRPHAAGQLDDPVSAPA